MAKIGDGKDITIIIGADDQTKAAFQSASAGAERLDKQVRKMGDAHEYAALGLRRMQIMLSGMAFGVVVGAVSALTQELIHYGRETEEAKKRVGDLTTQVEAQAKAWNLLTPAMSGVTQASVNLYNAQLGLLKLEAVDRISDLKKELEDLRKFSSEIEKNITTHPWIKGNEKNKKAMEEAMEKNKKVVEKSMAKQRIEIAKTTMEIEKYQEILKMQPTSLSQVNFNLAKKDKEELLAVTIALDDSYEKREKLIEAVSFATEKLGASKEELMAIEIRQFLAGGAEIEQLDRYVQALEAKLSKEKEIAEKEKELAIAKKMEAEKPPAQPKGATVPIVMQMDDTEIVQLQAKIALHEEYNRVIAQGNQTIEDRIIKAAEMGVITGEEMAHMLAGIQVAKVELALRQAMQSALVQYILGQQSLGQALQMALAQRLATIAAEAAVESLWEAAQGLASLAKGNMYSAGYHFGAATAMAAIAASTGYAAHGLAKASGYGQGPQGSFSNPNYNAGSSSPALTGGSGKSEGNTTYVYYINAIDTQTFSEYVKKNSGAITGLVAQDIRTRGEVGSAIKGNT